MWCRKSSKLILIMARFVAAIHVGTRDNRAGSVPMNIRDKSRYQEVYARSLRDPRGFWGEAAREIDWIEPATKVFDPAQGLYGRWFAGAVVNTCYNALDRHVARGRADQLALIHDSPLTNIVTRFTYAELLAEVQTLAAVMTDFGVVKGDRVILYMPMVPEAVVAMLACARIGAVHSVVFGGFAAKELATRIDDARPKLIFSASCGLEPGRIVHYKPLLDEAIGLAAAKPDACIILQRPQQACDLVKGRDHDWAGRARRRQASALRAGARDRPALHPLYIGHHRQAEGRGPRQWRASGRAEMVDVQSLRHQSRRGLVVRLRHRLGGRPQLHHLRSADPRRDLDHVRGQAGGHAGCRRLLARDKRAQGGRAVHRADCFPGHPQGRS
jgi:hypothetical protein